jgi:uncharacterized protein
MPLPEFKYHKKPLTSGVFIESEDECSVCGMKNKYRYDGPIFSEEEIESAICPECIKNGKAREKFQLEFVDRRSIGDNGRWENVGEEIKDIICFNTPGFYGYQHEKWWTHCKDAAVFLGSFNGYELKGQVLDDMENLLLKDGDLTRNNARKLILKCNNDSGPYLFLFQCLKCDVFGGYVDYD